MNEETHNISDRLPVIILADTSGSMAEDGKIHALNQSFRVFAEKLAMTSNGLPETDIALISFSDSAATRVAFTPADQVILPELKAGGRTALGAAVKSVQDLVHAKDIEQIYLLYPVVILVSDGSPTDKNWEPALNSFGETVTCIQKFALAIGADANKSILKKFTGRNGSSVFHAEDAAQIVHFFKRLPKMIEEKI